MLSMSVDGVIPDQGCTMDNISRVTRPFNCCQGLQHLLQRLGMLEQVFVEAFEDT